MSAGPSGVDGRSWTGATVVGVLLGTAYVLSPLTVLCVAAAAAIVIWAGRGLPEYERRWIRVLLIVAIALRIAAVAVLFMVSDRANAPFATLFGDEEFFIRRSIWLGNIAVGIPVHGADLIYAFDAVGETSYLYIVGLIQVLVGPSPYGVHLVAIMFYVSAAVLLYRLVRPTLGRMPALVGLALLLFLPSLFAWSISALKEPFFFLLTTAMIVLVVKMCRTPRWTSRALALVAIVVLIVVAETIRREGGMLAATSLVAGLAMAGLARRPRLLTVTVVVAPVVLGLALSRPAVQVKIYGIVQQGAEQHVGHINTPGFVFKTLDDRFYKSRADIGDMRLAEAGRFLIRSIRDYVTVPLPWDVQSPVALAYIPEQVIWYVAVAFLPAGLLFSFRRDALVTALLIAHALASAAIIAIISGNVGTLVRHRGMAIPYILWLSAVGGCEVVSRLARTAQPSAVARRYPANAEMEPRCP